LTSTLNCDIPIAVKKQPNCTVVSFVGKPGAGKTTFLERLIPELKARGFRVGTVKHDRGGFEMDQPGKDTWRHARAGSDVVVISSPTKMAMIRMVDQELTLDEVVASLPPLDIVLVEGYKQANKPKIEVSRRDVGTELLCAGPDLIAIVSDQRFAQDVPHFALDDARGVADLIEQRVRDESQQGLRQGG
jgi:molybdopterin-guanine dinucleotide biosynthesis adapter protein